MFVERWVRVFSVPKGTFVGEVQLGRFSLPDFQKQFGLEPDNAMHDSYPIEPRHAEFIQGYLQQKVDWDFERHSYRLEADLSC